MTRFGSYPSSDYLAKHPSRLLWRMSLLCVLICPVKVSAKMEQYFGQIHGFLSQGYSLSSDNNFHGNSQNNGSFDFRELGINMSRRMNQRTLIAGQILSSKSGTMSNSNAKVDFLLLDYRVASGMQQNTGIQLGRVKNPFGFYNETRDVPFTRPSVILPQSIYFDRTRDLTLSSDGLQLYSSIDSKQAVWRGQLQIAFPRLDSDKTETILFNKTTDGEFTALLSYICKISYEQEGRGLNLALSLVQLNSEYNPATGSSGTFKYKPRIFSMQYNTLNWSISSEYARRPFFFENLPLLLPLQRLEGESYYLQSTWRFRRGFSSFVRYDVAYLDRNDKDGNNWEKLTGGLVPAYTRFARDWTLGLRWTINKSWEAALENHWVDGGAWLAAEENPIPTSIVRNWRLLSGNISYRF